MRRPSSNPLNFETGKVLGLTIPPSVLKRADQVIQQGRSARCLTSDEPPTGKPEEVRGSCSLMLYIVPKTPSQGTSHR